MKVRYIGENIGIDGLFNGHTYEVVEIESEIGAIRIIDESGEDYLYSPSKPKSAAGEYKGGRFEVVEDDEKASLARAIKGDWN